MKLQDKRQTTETAELDERYVDRDPKRDKTAKRRDQTWQQARRQKYTSA